MADVKPFKGVIFDMDNTLLKSSIDFECMKKTVYDFLLAKKMIQASLTWRDKTASQIIEEGRLHPDFHLIESMVWKLVEEVEAKGMHEAKLEPHALDILHHLKAEGRILTILTNNAFRAAKEALERLAIFHLFDLVLGREDMEALKPSPSGVNSIINRWKHAVEKDEWVLVGDSWIDGAAAHEAGVKFIAYQSEPGRLVEKGIVPVKQISNLKQLEEIV